MKNFDQPVRKKYLLQTLIFHRLQNAKTEEELVQKKNVEFSEPVDLHEFARILRLDVKDPSTYQLFRIQDRVSFF